MIECKCDAPDVEFTVVKDLKSGLILIQASCSNCGMLANGYGRTVEQALLEVHKEWKRNIRRQHR